MNILVIGNGFDLAHGLPTKYTDFLFFCDMILKIVEVNCAEFLVPENKEDYKKWLNDGSKIPLANTNDLFKYYNEEYSTRITERDKKVYRAILDDYFISDFLSDEYDIHIKKEIIYLVYNNNWIKYFLQSDMHGTENWIDFESEISHLIQSMDKDIHASENSFDLYDDIEIYFSSDFLENLQEVNGCETFKEIRDLLEKDLNALIRALEIYLCEYVEKTEIQKKSPDIDGLENDFILSFNYTHTFSKLYDVSSRSKQEVTDPFDYIHGEANISNAIDSNNMVLGIDEFLPDDRKNKDIEFIAFKKFYQRIYKGTGCKYKEWVDLIKKNEWELKEKYKKEYSDRVPFKQHGEKRHCLYIFGHSLDVTDKDILRDLILNDNVYTTIFYHDKDTMGQQIANLVKVIGQDELIRRTGGSTKTIEFRQQQDMVPIKQEDS